MEAADSLFAQTNLLVFRDTTLGSYLGTPGVSCPAGLTGNGCPVGVLIYMPFGEDDRVLSAASAFENCFNMN